MELLEECDIEQIGENLNNPEKLKKILKQDLSDLIFYNLIDFFESEIADKLIVKDIDIINEELVEIKVKKIIVEEKDKKIVIRNAKEFAEYVHPKLDINNIIKYMINEITEYMIDEFDIYKGTEDLQLEYIIEE
ncbi:MAG: hypothetical protein QXX30_00850 [Candidatus Aenigmatarchaeota archaeon]